MVSRHIRNDRGNCADAPNLLWRGRAVGHHSSSGVDGPGNAIGNQVRTTGKDGDPRAVMKTDQRQDCVDNSDGPPEPVVQVRVLPRHPTNTSRDKG
jgi:hypothetical protein